jgi:hypothetical protein
MCQDFEFHVKKLMKPLRVGGLSVLSLKRNLCQILVVVDILEVSNWTPMNFASVTPFTLAATYLERHDRSLTRRATSPRPQARRYETVLF